MLEKPGTKKYVLILFSLSLITHSYLFLNKDILTFGDWVFFYPSQFKDFTDFGLYLSSYGLGMLNPFPNNWIFYLLYYLGGYFDLGWDFLTRFIFLVPIIFFTPLVSFFSIRYFLRDNFVAFLSSCIYCFNSFFLTLVVSGWFTYAYTWFIFPLLLFLVVDYLERNSKLQLVFIALLTFWTIIFEIRISLLLLFSLGIYLVTYLLFSVGVFRNKLFSCGAVVFSIFFGVLMHSFWLIPVLFINFKELTSFASSSVFNSFYNLLDVLALRSYQWSENMLMVPFVRQPFDIHFTFLALFGGFGLYLAFFKIKSRVFFRYLAVLFILFGFLAKQSSLPFRDLYAHLFELMPFFNLYRESSKFFILVAFAISVFSGVAIKFFAKLISPQKKTYVFFAVPLLFLVSFVNTVNFITGDIGGIVQGRKIHPDYRAVATYLLEDPSFSRVLWVPRRDRFSYFSSLHPGIHFNQLEPCSEDTGASGKFQSLSSCLEEPLFLNNMSVRYIAVLVGVPGPYRVAPDTVHYLPEHFRYFKPRQEYIAYFDSLEYLNRIDIGVSDLVIYENPQYKERVYLTESLDTVSEYVKPRVVPYKARSSTEYRVSIDNFSGERIYVNFTDTFNKNWDIYLGSFSWFDVLTNSNKLGSEAHLKTDAGLNSFLLERQYIIDNFNEGEHYSIDAEGNLSIEATIFLKSQAYFNVGLLISGTIALLLVLFVLIYFLRGYRVF